jgi:MFS superfamily sulfate permease-like transporter
LPSFDFAEFENLFRDAAGITLISFTSGVLTAKSFARRNRYDIDANQELMAFGACNLASGLAQGFPVSGAASRTAVNDATGGRTQLVGIVAGGAMLVFLLFLTAPLAYLPTTALAAVIIVSAYGLFDFAALRSLWSASGRELSFSIGTTVGVLIFGVLPGVLLAVVLSLIWLLSIGSRPHDAILGRVAGDKGFHDIADYPEAETIPGLLIYRFDANVVFFNCDYLKERVLKEITEAKTSVEWVIIDASPINVVDYTALRKLDELREELRARGIVLVYAATKQSLARFFRPSWITEREEETSRLLFPTVKLAINAFEHRTQQPNSVGEAEQT